MRRYDVHTTVAGHTMLAGTITVGGYGDRAVTDFKYDPAYMYNPDSFDLAPSVRRIVGEYTTRQLPFFLQDAGPDRWGTHLVQRSFEAHRVGRNPDDLDCVVAASDRARQGALRLSDDDGNWVGDDEIPLHTDLADLLEAADQVAANTDSWDAYAALLRTGTSALGGARAKASVTADDGQLWIAKFPMEADRWDIPVWEKTALDLAERAGFTVPQTRLVQVAGRNVLLLKRFDRDGATRIPYLTMRTLLNNPDDGGRVPDYRDIATSLRHFGGEDLPDLYRRAAFGVLINNTDDHLRNHGLLRIDGSWRLAPMFDVNPEQETGRERHTGIAGRFTQLGVVDGLIELGRHCGLPGREAIVALHDLHDHLQGWQDLAAANGANHTQLNRFAAALRTVHDAVASQMRGGGSAVSAAGKRRAKTTGASTPGPFPEPNRPSGRP